MLSITLQILMLASFIALLVLIWRVSRWPRWRIRAVVYGWGASFLWALLWSILLPMWLKGVMDSQTLHSTFPDGTFAAGFLFCGWFCPAIVVAIRSNRDKRKAADDHLA